MVAEIAKTLAGTYSEENPICVIEAGTGTGKSMAYLLGSLPIALSQGKKVCISTATVALQEQLLQHELPQFLKDTEIDISYGLAKGRQRYVCRSRLMQCLAAPEDLLDEASFNASQLKHLEALQEALNSGTWAGDLESLPETIDDALWQRIASQSHNCHRHLKGHSQCPYHQARDEMTHWDLIVTNHHMLVADLALGGGVILPELDETFHIIDEAHHLPLTMRDSSKTQTSIKSTSQWLSKQPKALQALIAKIGHEDVNKQEQKLIKVCTDLVKDLQELYFILNQNRLCDNDEQRYRAPMGQLPESIAVSAAQLKQLAALFLNTLDEISTKLNEHVKTGESSKKNQHLELIANLLGPLQQRMEQFHQVWSDMCQHDPEEKAPLVKWFEKHQSRQEVDFIAQTCPIEVGDNLHEKLWAQAAGVVLCSATLRALRRFEFFQKQAGIPDNKGTKFMALPSPFDYPSNATLYLPKMDHEPNHDEFTNELIEKIPHLIQEGTGNLVLFSSYKQMNEVAKALEKRYKNTLQVQGEETVSNLIKAHKQRCDDHMTSILFGTSSFSEGLDLPGHYLTNLIMTKLPFAVPTSPVEEAQAEWVKTQGAQPFWSITLPDASKKLIQSCGRLLRTETDYGRVVLLDKRVTTKSYGQRLIEALPPFQIERGSCNI